jgi:hypothetical protein
MSTTTTTTTTTTPTLCCGGPLYVAPTNCKNSVTWKATPKTSTLYPRALCATCYSGILVNQKVTYAYVNPEGDQMALELVNSKKRKNEEDLSVSSSSKAPKLSELTEQRRLIKEAKKIALEAAHAKELDERFNKAQQRFDYFFVPLRPLTEEQSEKVFREFKGLDEDGENGSFEGYNPEDHLLYFMAMLAVLDPEENKEDENEDEEDEDEDDDKGGYKASVVQRYTKDNLVICVKVPCIFPSVDEFHFNDDNFKIAIPLFEKWEKIHPEWKLYDLDRGERGAAGKYPKDGRIHVFRARLTAAARLLPEEEIKELGMDL